MEVTESYCSQGSEGKVKQLQKSEKQGIFIKIILNYKVVFMS